MSTSPCSSCTNLNCLKHKFIKGQGKVVPKNIATINSAISYCKSACSSCTNLNCLKHKFIKGQGKVVPKNIATINSAISYCKRGWFQGKHVDRQAGSRKARKQCVHFEGKTDSFMTLFSDCSLPAVVPDSTVACSSSSWFVSLVKYNLEEPQNDENNLTQIDSSNTFGMATHKKRMTSNSIFMFVERFFENCETQRKCEREKEILKTKLL